MTCLAGQEFYAEGRPLSAQVGLVSRATRTEPPSVLQISSFYGITIWMYYDEALHGGHPHFHARYGDDEASVDIESLDVIAGGLPPRARRLVVEWAEARQAQLRGNWARARAHRPLVPIEPLK